MSYNSSTGVISAPVDIRDVQKALGTSRGDLGQLCTHQNINVWAKYKPVRFNQIDTTKNANTNVAWLNNDKTWNSNAQWWRYSRTDSNVSVNGCVYRCGFEVPMVPIFDLQTSGLGEWTYLRPRGNSVTPNEPYRLIDFNQYFNRAVCPFSIVLPTEATHPLYLDGKISAFTPTMDDLNLTLKDIFGLGQDSSVYIGIALFKGPDYSEMWWCTQNGSSPTITFQSSNDEMLKNFTGTVRLVAFATTSQQPQWTKWEETVTVYSLKAPNISFSVIGDCTIKPQPTITYDIAVEGMDFGNDANFMRTILKVGKSGEYVSGETRYGQTSQDKLSRDYTLTGIRLDIYSISNSGGMTIESSVSYYPNTLSAEPTYLIRESYVKYILKTKEPSGLPLQPDHNTMRRYVFIYE